jgi:hypothetical protein
MAAQETAPGSIGGMWRVQVAVLTASLFVWLLFLDGRGWRRQW